MVFVAAAYENEADALIRRKFARRIEDDVES
jgi:hypothetical protein